ncbi:L-seryl-tRNA(Sec) selenium transferase [Hydrogenobacter sp. T-2]|uniref:L-seryl-tRNA(Sec) selenium transferase n=1 Tax=Pampinifervens diazotrophicum TaxID=1632018 RepID=UPI002B25F353|nr:L-seryl-tRNA(Sec) selenium transferase [Hydrogenobacter sp. T-2]WPM31762.1 L-seryl-tRNA(Sec) selenium transferase [Hydrogenobacter sp. T-2]
MSLFRHIPQVSKLLEDFRDYPQEIAKRAIREVLQKVREEIKEGRRQSLEDLRELIEKRIRELTTTNLRRVINATGVVINTNLGRSVLSEEVADFIKEIAVHYSNLEYDLSKGRRGSRLSHVEELLRVLTGAEAVHVVNNNAGAVYLVLNTLAFGKEVVVSRGELVEIGGSFRIPDIMRASGAKLVEVGTTNRTRLSDYERAISSETALLMKVHRSNFYMEGFVEEVKAEELLSLGLPLYYDMGSGSLVNLRSFGINTEEPSFEECIKSGIHVVSGSGDKLLGGPQAGIIVGKREFIERIRKNPMSRALRIDKLTLAGLEMTLRLYMQRDYEKIPTLRMLLQKPEEIRKRALRLSRRLRSMVGLEVRLLRDISRCGGGAMPELSLETYCLGLRHKSLSPVELEKKLRNSDPPIIARIRDDMVLLDMRTVEDGDIPDILKALELLEV